ncbi:MAG: phospholipase D family protein [Acidobacteriota bacterium]
MIERKRAALLVLLFCVTSALLLAHYNTLPSLSGRSVSSAFLDTDSTRLGRMVVPLVGRHAPQCGVYPLRDARDAFAARVQLAETSQRSLDVQYYIWHKDLSGMLLLDALRRAADRGVRVRLLLDDNNTLGLDPTLAALDSHPNIEVRLFNPFAIRRVRALGYLTDFSRLNRRMHNKSFTADNQVTIVGGRNVGDEYFGAADDVLFADLDVMVGGPVAREVSSQFDRYWASDSAYPVGMLVPGAGPDSLRAFAAEALRVAADPAAVTYRNAVAASSFMRDLAQGTLPLEWASVRMLSDDPHKGLGPVPADRLLVEELKSLFGEPKKELDLVSPYFVPRSAGVDLFTGWAAHGVKVRVLTNSLEATDVAAVHAGYAKRRLALLAAGVSLYELRRSSETSPNRAAGSLTATSGSGSSGSSGSSLHAKTFAVDGSRAFVGSFNFDPRSAKLNTEMGLVIDSPALAHRIEAAFEARIPEEAYEVRLSDDRQLYWIERRDGRIVRHDTEPGTTFWQRAGVWLLSRLPIEWLL